MLTDSTLQAWLAISAVDITAIGLFSLLGIPYVLKFLWAPLLDRYSPRWLGRRRGWIAASQFLLVALILGFAFQDPSKNIHALAWMALALTFVSATQDIAIDAYRAEILRPKERGLGAGLSVAGYRIGIIVSGAGAYLLADHVGFNVTYAALAAVAALGLFATVAASEPKAPVGLPGTMSEVVIQPFHAFLRRPESLGLIALVCLYKFGDAAAGRLTTTFFVRHLEFSLTEIGVFYKGIGISSSLLGGIFGGALMFRWGLYRSLLVFGVIQAVTNIGFMFLAISGKSYVTMITVVALENVSGGMGTAALVALLIAICDRRYTATQFALLTAVASIGRVLSGPPAGYLVEAFGWVSFFFFTAVIALPGIILVFILRGNIDRYDIMFTIRPDER
ncbi:MAG TPA: muropeptide transporter AmpG [Gammaproteobacteria bacterium]|nr:muropeptide transporter AmpG [Gammaproteobacteria bacterium]